MPMMNDPEVHWTDQLAATHSRAAAAGQTPNSATQILFTIVFGLGLLGYFWANTFSTSFERCTHIFLDTCKTMALHFGNFIRPLSPSTSSSIRSILGIDTQSLLSLPSTVGQKGLSYVRGRARERPAGLGNWDNSCYQNSMIQGLASLLSLPEYLRSVCAEHEQDGSMTSTALLDVMRTLNSPEWWKGHLVAPETEEHEHVSATGCSRVLFQNLRPTRQGVPQDRARNRANFNWTRRNP